MDADDVLAEIDLVLGGFVDRDWSVSPDAMRWAPDELPEGPAGDFDELIARIATWPVHPHCRCTLPSVAPSEQALATARQLREGTGVLALKMHGGPADGQVHAAENPGYPPTAYRFGVMPFLLDLPIWELEMPVRPLKFDEYVFDNVINEDGSLRYRYLGRF